MTVGVLCIGTFLLYNIVRPDTTTIEGEEVENIIYISRQTVRFTRCMYFFLWFQHSFIQFSTSTNEDDLVMSRSRARDLNMRLKNSRLISPFVSPALRPVNKDVNVSDVGNTDGDGEDESFCVNTKTLPDLIPIRNLGYDLENETPWWKQADELAEGEDERRFLRGAMGKI